MALSADNQRLVTAARDLGRRDATLKAVLALSLANDDAVVAEKRQEAALEGGRLRRRFEAGADALSREAKLSEGELEAAKAGLAEAERLEKASLKVDDWLLRPPTLRERVGEGQKSMWGDKAERVVSRPSGLRIRKGLFEKRSSVSLGPAAAAELTGSMAVWTEEWLRFVLREVRQDLLLFLQDLWRSPDGDLPEPWPFSAEQLDTLLGGEDELPVAAWQKGLPEDLIATYEQASVFGLFVQSFRGQLYPIAFLLPLFGVAGAQGDLLQKVAPWLLPVVLVSVGAEYRANRADGQERARKDLARLLTEWAGRRNERNHGRIVGWVGWRLRVAVRDTFLAWHREQVLPRVAGARRRVADAGERVREAAEKRRVAERDAPARELAAFLDLAGERR